jgi:hypothetical protein
MKPEDGLDAVTRIPALGDLQQQVAYSANLQQQSSPKLNLMGFSADDAANQFATDQFTKMVMNAYQVQGIKAFENTQRTTALHEAGHCVIGTAIGRTITRTKIKRAWSSFTRNKSWTGRTYDGVSDLTGPDTSVASDFNFARFVIAGLMAEITFNGADFRVGSSLDEVVQFQLAINNIAVKMNQDDAQTVALEQLRWVTETLQANKAIVLEIADLLMRRGTLRGAVLEKILRGVK